MKLKKILIIHTIIIIFMLSFNFVYADSASITSQAKDWIETGESGNTLQDLNTMGNTHFLDIAGLLLAIGIFVAVGVGMILGIKFMFAAPHEKAEVSKLMIPYIIGTALVVGSLSIWKLSINLFQ